jgi:hypothetical protein
MTHRGRSVDRRTFIQQCATGALSFGLGSVARAAVVPRDGEVLYNGIRLTAPWPPPRQSLPVTPVLPPYLADPPRVIPIDVGRQLFVDDFLIEESRLERTYHAATYHAGNPVLSPTKPWETFDEYAERTHTRSNPAAMPFSDGVFYDPRDRVFKMWYMGGYSHNVCYAVSTDGLAWDKPALDVVAGTNITLSMPRDSSTVWLDLAERDPAARFKLAVFWDFQLELFTSADGMHWRRRGSTGWVLDRTTFFYNPFRKVWVFSIRDEIIEGVRARRYWEARDFVSDASWRKREPVVWTGADALDPRRPEYNVPAQLYNLDCVGYESLVLGLFTIWRGETNIREKPNDIVLGYSRDGFHWHRPDRRPFIPVSEHVGDWNWGNVQSTGGVCQIVGDRLYFYVSGRRGVPGSDAPGVCSTGLATLRRDGFASLAEPAADARARRVWPGGATAVTTRPVRFSGGYLFVNADARGGEVRVDVLDEAGQVLEPFSAAHCSGVREDGTRLPVTWTRGSLAALAGQTVRFRFLVRGARLYAFWVSPTAEGRSRGYLAAGGPGLMGAVD